MAAWSHSLAAALKSVPSAQTCTAGRPIQQLINFLQSCGCGKNPLGCGQDILNNGTGAAVVDVVVTVDGVGFGRPFIGGVVPAADLPTINDIK